MAKRSSPHLSPIVPVKFVTKAEILIIPPDEVSKEQIGKKAFGLACIPPSWTLPFVVISNSLLNDFRAWPAMSCVQVYTALTLKALSPLNLAEGDAIIVRSSGQKEGLAERGKFYSKISSLKSLDHTLLECLQMILDDPDLNDEQVPFIVQTSPKLVSRKGHLSNERRWYEDTRDWLGEIDDRKTPLNFSINLRNWRKKYSLTHQLEEPLHCNLQERIPEILKLPAIWAYNLKVRVHFEWLWDGSSLYVVQADEEHDLNGINPTKPRFTSDNAGFSPRCLSPINEAHAARYHKVKNVFTYQQLGLPVSRLLVLDDQSVISDLIKRRISDELKGDLEELVKHSLVIRVDVAIDDKRSLQLLPRTHEVRDVNAAILWLFEKSVEVRETFPTDDIIFLFHNFIPAVSSAFAYAVPGQRKVQIEALWGLPEGLYYNSHDKYVVDTFKPTLASIKTTDIDKFGVAPRIKCKQFCVIPDSTGRWATRPVSASYQWKESIQDRSWVKLIAYHSRRIAELEQRPLSIMWFVGVPPQVCGSAIFPWFHETLDAQLTTKPASQRSKTPFDVTFLIRTSADLEKLRHDAETGVKNIRLIRIQPFEESLLRNKNTLKTIGELAKKIDAVILLEGGILSHAYYQLMETKAVVEVKNPFEGVEGKREFYKLVRDKIPSNINLGGETVRTAKLDGSSLLRALREKLVEEAFEVLDAVDQEDILGELADISEVIDGILRTLSSSREELRLRQEQKRQKAGGFSDGLVLLETSNPALVKSTQSSMPLFEEDDTNVLLPIKPNDILELAHTVNKWSDRRDHAAASEVLLKLDVPFVCNSWSANTPETIVDAASSTIMKTEISGKRNGARMEIQLSIFKSKQGKLFDS
jgi:predicted house-cleaning noncanonical NTP pyrophosphatase (MazG superfamily)